MLQGVNEEGLRWDFTKGSLEGLQTDDELTSHLAGQTVQCGVDQTKNPTVNSPHLIHSTRRWVDFWATINTDSTSLVSFSFSFPSRQAFWLERMQKSRIPTTSFRSIVDEYLSTLVRHLQWRGKSSKWRKCSSKTAWYAMIPIGKNIPFERESAPSLPIDAGWARAFAESKFETMHGGPPTEGWFRQLCFAARSGCSLQQAGRTWHREMADYARWCAWWSIDHDRGARASLASAKKFLLSLSAPRCCGFVTSRSQLRFVAVVGEIRTVLVSFSGIQAVTDRCAPAFGAFFYWFSVWRRRRRSALSWRSTVGGSFFFLSSPLELPAIRLEGILLLTPSLVGLLLQYTRNPRQTGRKRKRSSTQRRSPATNKVVEILILGTYLLRDHSFDYLRASPSNSRDTPLWSYDFAFLEKSLKKWRKIPPHRNKRPKTKKMKSAPLGLAGCQEWSLTMILLLSVQKKKKKKKKT